MRERLREAASSLRKETAASLWLLLLFASCAGLALGCGWSGFENSVRFNFTATDRDRSRLPPLPLLDVRGEKKTEGGRVEYVSPKQRAAQMDALWDEAGEAVSAGELLKARKLLAEYVERTPVFVCGAEAWTQPLDCQTRRNYAFDRLDALASLERGSTDARVRSYLEARAAYEAWLAPVKSGHNDDAQETYSMKSTPEQSEQAAREKEERASGMKSWDDEVEAKLKTIESDPNLADNAAYLRAAGVYNAGRPGDALEAFESVAAKYPGGEKREAALYMAGRLALESSASYAGEGETATSTEACRDECRDEFWTRSRKNFLKLIESYPRGRYASDARGWLAYLDLRVGDKAGALVEYYRLLGDASDESGRDLAVRSLRLTRGLANDSDMDSVERELEDEPRAALAYAYHNVYSYSQSYYLNVPELADDGLYGDSQSDDARRWEEHEESELRESAERKELKRAADFASRVLRRNAGAGFGGAFLVRLAESQFELGETKQALEAARRALASGLEADERGQAMWVEGASEYRLKNYAAARRTLTRLTEEFPRGDLARRARVLLATAAEDSGDLSGALEQYLALGYDPDVTYFVDVLLTPDQLAAFVAAHEASPRRDELLYSLGLRYMRAGRYAEARAAFSRVRTSVDDYSLLSRERHFSADETGPIHPKLNFRHDFWEEDVESEYSTWSDANKDTRAGRDTRVYADWLLRDTQTLSDLERLRGEIDRARDNESKAEAMYQLASYFYEGELLFYNPALWRGMRAEMIGSLSEMAYRSPDEAQAVWLYEQEHEGAARAVALYLEVVRLYPKTRAARDSLYTAILCHHQLSEFNGYWRTMYGNGLHAGAALVTYGDLRRAYPDYRLPIGTYGWEPSTRTVNGGPAWPAPPKPKQLTGMERARSKIALAERRVSQVWKLFGGVYGGRLRDWTVKALRWTLAALIALFVLLVFRRTRRARHFLYGQLARRIRRGRATRIVRAPYAPTSSYAAHVPYEWGGRARAAACDTARGLLRLALHERGRAALALNLFTHGLLTLLVWSLLWAAQ
jgi:outer membrane protein assembly factor BamD (BamD/ComL family)